MWPHKILQSVRTLFKNKGEIQTVSDMLKADR